VNIILPDPDGEIARRRAAARGVTVEEYLADLVHADDFDAWFASLTPAQQAAYEEKERAIEQGLASGPPILVDDAYWKEKLRALRERRAAKRGGPAAG
jgi:hypothetical protein